MSKRKSGGLRTRKAAPNMSPTGVRRRGQAIVETGFVIVILLLLSLGLFQYGMIYSSSLALNNLAREGARYAAVRSLTTPNDAALKTAVVGYLKARAAGTIINQNALDSSAVVIERTSNVAGQELRVRINYNLKNKSFAPNLLPLPARYASYQATSANLIEN